MLDTNPTQREIRKTYYLRLSERNATAMLNAEQTQRKRLKVSWI
jgi:hypothetical protein